MTLLIPYDQSLHWFMTSSTNLLSFNNVWRKRTEVPDKESTNKKDNQAQVISNVGSFGNFTRKISICQKLSFGIHETHERHFTCYDFSNLHNSPHKHDNAGIIIYDKY